MIKDMWSLKYEGKIMGVRVLTATGEYFDIDIDVFKKQLGLDPKPLKSLRLLEFGDLLMTEDEFDTGLTVADGSNNKRLLKALLEFAKDSPEAKRKREKKIQELRSTFWVFIPSKWLNEFVEYHLNYFEGNNNIYDRLTANQVKLVREYFRWRSKLIFDENKYSKILRKSLSKAKELAALMGDADDWYYDGTVDTGVMGGGQCELGHALRYEHYAYSPSLNKHIIFGVTCISDFFELDKRVLNNIIRAQEFLMNELKSVVFIMKTGKAEEYSKEYGEVWDVLKFYKGRFDDVVPNGAGWSYFIGGFLKNRIPLTKSMIDQYKKLLWSYRRDKANKEATQAGNPVGVQSTVQSPSNPQSPTSSQNPQRVAGVSGQPSGASDQGSSSYTNPFEGMLRRIEKAGEAGVIPKTLFAFTIIPSIRRYGRMSPKQKKYIDQALDMIPPDFDESKVGGTSSQGPSIQSGSGFVGGSVKRNIGSDGVDYTDIF